MRDSNGPDHDGKQEEDHVREHILEEGVAADTDGQEGRREENGLREKVRSCRIRA
jgi:hypothetical protein